MWPIAGDSVSAPLCLPTQPLVSVPSAPIKLPAPALFFNISSYSYPSTPFVSGSPYPSLSSLSPTKFPSTYPHLLQSTLFPTPCIPSPWHNWLLSLPPLLLAFSHALLPPLHSYVIPFLCIACAPTWGHGKERKGWGPALQHSPSSKEQNCRECLAVTAALGWSMLSNYGEGTCAVWLAHQGAERMECAQCSWTIQRIPILNSN